MTTILPQMTLSLKGATFLRGLEGFVAHWYPDAGGLGTIGIGFTWHSAAFRAWWAANMPGVVFGPGATMTREQADDALIYIAAHEYGQAVNAFFGHPVEQHVFDGVFSPVYNLGEGCLAWRWAKALAGGDVKRSTDLLKITGTTADGRVLLGLVRRRADEAELIRFGDYTIGPMPDDAMADGVLVRRERGPAVASLIKDLDTLGFYHGSLDDVFGHGTEAAVLAFQRANHLTADGKAGPNTLGAIRSAVTSLHA